MTIGEELRCGLRFGFRDSADIEPLVERVAAEWFFGGKMTQYLKTERSAFLPYTAEGMTHQLANCFASAIDGNNSEP
jgi:hypothetical protein